MATTPYDIIAGPGAVYCAPVGTAFPAVNLPDTDVSFNTWTKLGLTEGGIAVQHMQTINMLPADQRTGPVKAIRTAEGLEITFALMELTLANYAAILNNMSVTTGTSPNRNIMNLYQDFDVAQFAFLARGPSPYMSSFCQYQVPVAVQIDQPQPTFKRDDKATLAVKFSALVDPNAASSGVRFGTLVAQTS